LKPIIDTTPIAIAGPNLMYGLFTAWSQMLIGFVVTAGLMAFNPELNPFFAQTLPIGFAGGHGTAASLAKLFKDVGYPEGVDIALGTATVGTL
jgi:ESS family glutamate:Na+ symporter